MSSTRRIFPIPIHGPPVVEPFGGNSPQNEIPLEDVSTVMRKGPSVKGHTVEQMMTGYPTSTIIEVNNATQHVMMNPMVTVNRG